MFENDRRPDVPTVVGFVVILLLAGGVILAAAGGIVSQSPLLGSAGDDSIEAGITAAENETEAPPDSSPTTASTQAETPPSTTDTPDDSESSSDDSGGAESVTETETASQTATEADTSDDSSGSGGSGDSGGSSSSSSSSDESTDSSELSADGEDTDTETSTPAATETAEPQPATETEEPATETESADSEPEDDSPAYAPEEDERAELDSGPTNGFDMLISDQWVEWWLENGATGILVAEQSGTDDPIIIIHEGHRAPDVPNHAADGIEWRPILHDGPLGYAPPEGFEHEQVEGESYDYGMAISDAATRDVLSDDPVVGVTMQWSCPDPEDRPYDCDDEEQTALMIFHVDHDVDGSEAYVENAPRWIEGYPVTYT